MTEDRGQKSAETTTEAKPLIFDSAKEFLTQALRDYEKQMLNFAIVHAMIAVELMLKERLTRIHPTLVYENIDSGNLQRAKTVSAENIPRRLKNLDVKLDQAEVELINLIRQWRNDVVHHMPEFDPNTAKKKLVCLFDFFASFCRREFDLSLKNFIPAGLFKLANELLDDWQVDVKKAQEEAKATGHVLEHRACPDCGAIDVLSLYYADDVQCHFCGSTRYCFFHCTECGHGVLETSFNNQVCTKCEYETVAGWAVDEYIDRIRGK